MRSHCVTPLPERSPAHWELHVTPARSRAEGIFAFLLTRDQPASSAITQDLLGWKPTHPGLIEDIEQGHYFT